MKRLGLALVAAVLGLSGVLVAAPAQAYPSITVTISDVRQVGGRKIVITAKADPAINGTWVLIYHAKTGDQVVTGSGSSISHVYNTRRVSRIVHESATASFTFDDTDLPLSAGSFGAASTSVATAVRTVSATGAVTLLPLRGNNGDDDDDSNGDDDDDNGHLPNTGGERLAWLIIGLLLVAAGTAVVASSRKRSSRA